MKKILYWVGGVIIGLLLLLTITNPTTKDFKRYIKSKGPVLYQGIITKTNHYIFTNYEVRFNDRSDSWGYKFIGVFGNFIQYSRWAT